MKARRLPKVQAEGQEDQQPEEPQDGGQGLETLPQVSTAAAAAAAADEIVPAVQRQHLTEGNRQQTGQQCQALLN